ncbi:glycoside hydrolase family 78 protein [Gelatoporia subvermispora B]|uniref:Glycoside hydrolase family 78 protein n=1 Tax=Ceriporiopsis subvermispora (strain B) TaxID=914234 RepID=M2R8Z6_CERS8|nr:glycoside hydrolase family 78 protein [Gelatoporia subvermispora B]
MYLWSLLVFLCTVPVQSAAPNGPWDAFNYAPESRTVQPRTIRGIQGDVSNADALLNEGTVTLSSNGSYLTVDFGLEVGGLISMTFEAIKPSSAISLSFTESPLFISPLTSDDSAMSASNMSYDGVLHVPPPISPGFWTQPSVMLRGGFRFLTIVSNSDEPVSFSNLTCAISFMPQMEDLRDYTGYFYSLDPAFHDPNFLTKIWYSGAYTVQTDTVPVNTGRQVPFMMHSWANNATLGVAGPIIVDGAKRDRAVWPGDMGIAVPTQFVSTNDLVATKNALSTMFAGMNPETGALPESGPPLSQQGSDTYHAWTLVGSYNYYLYSGDLAWLTNTWPNYTKAVQFLEGKIDDSGLLNVTGLRDWGRLGQGGHNAEANALLYKVWTNSISLAEPLNETALASAWQRNASALKEKYNEVFWLPSRGMYRDNETTTLCPQDANSLAVVFNLTTSAAQASAVSDGLAQNWNEFGPVAPELPDTISPFISGFELQAHFESSNDDRAMELLRREWGYMLYTNISVQSTLLEGYTSNGSLYYRSYQGYDYDPSYTSHAHGWSTGPTSALTFYVLGLMMTSPQGATWSVAPHHSGLSSAEGGFETGLGWFGVKWSASGSSFHLAIDTPADTRGVVSLPMIGTLTIDGEQLWPQNGIALELVGGSHVITVQT